MSTREKIGAGLIIALAAALFLQRCINSRERDNLVTDIANYSDSAKYYKVKVDGLEVDVAYNKSLVLENKDQVSALIKKNDTLYKLFSKFKDVGSATIVNNYTTINNDTIRLKGDSIPCDFKAFKVRRDSVHYHFVGTIAKNFFTIDTLYIPNKQSFVIGKKKLGFLRGTEERIEIVNSNPLVKVSTIESYVVSRNKKRFGIGISAGYGIMVGQNSVTKGPYIGISASYNPIQF